MHASASGGTGRRAGLRILWGNPWEFESPLAQWREPLFVMRHDRRYVVPFNVTAYPMAAWTAQQIIEAFPLAQVLRFLIRDRDSIYGECFRERVKHIGIEPAELGKLIATPQAGCLHHRSRHAA